MALHIGRLYWPGTSPERNFPGTDWMDGTYEVLVVGGGMSGALAAFRLSEEGKKVLLVEKNTIASGSTAANTGLIQFMSDMGLSEYSEAIGETEAKLFYEWSRQGVENLRRIDKLAESDVDSEAKDTVREDFDVVNSILVATQRRAKTYLEEEMEAHKQQGFGSSLIDKDQLSDMGIKGHEGLETGPDIFLNPFSFVQRIVTYARKHFGLTVAEHVCYEGFDGDQNVILSSSAGTFHLKIPKIVIACGYMPPLDIATKLKNLELYVSYVYVTDPMEESPIPKKLIWERKDPYTYLRQTFTKAIMLGGKDLKDKELLLDKLPDQVDKLAKNASKWIEGIEEDGHKPYSYAAFFGESKDDLPYIGVDPDNPDVFIICGLGGNGTVYSAIASDMVLEWLEGTPRAGCEMFRIDR